MHTIHFILHKVHEWLLTMNKHVWNMLTELWLLLVLHDCKPIAAGVSIHAEYAVEVTVNMFQDVGTVKQKVLLD